MTESNLLAASQKESEENFVTKFVQETMQTMTHADEEAALAWVQKLRDSNPNATVDALAERIIRHKCMQAGAIGAVTASPTLIPGLGTVVALTFGTAVDLRMMYKLQGELVLALINLYAPTLSLENKHNALMIVTGIGIGANQLLSEGGQELAAKTTQRLASKFGGTVAEEVAEDAATGIFTKSVSAVLGVAAAAGINMLTTYTIGHRAQAYLKQGPEAMEDWTASLRTVTGVDERKLIAWLVAATNHSWQQIRKESKERGLSLVTAGQSAKELYIVKINQAGQQVVETSSYIAEQSSNGFSKLATVGRHTGQGIAARTNTLLTDLRERLTGTDTPPTNINSPVTDASPTNVSWPTVSPPTAVDADDAQ